MASVQPFSFGDLLRRYRIAAGLTQEELAVRARLSAKAISALENGTRLTPRAATVTLLADALNLSDPERAQFIVAGRARSRIISASAPSGSPSSSRRRGLTPLVGRHHERVLLDGCLASDGTPALLLAGEPGIGKSRLLEETAERARERGWTVLAGGCHRRSGQEPYAPFVGMFARFLAGSAPAQQRLYLQGCAWLARLVPEVAEIAVAPTLTWKLPPEQERRLMFAAVARLLENVAGPAGTMLLLDDLHWAGADALDLLAFLLRQSVPTGCSIQVVGAYRDTEIAPQDPLASLQADFAREGLAVRVALMPLERSEAEELLTLLLADVEVPAEERLGDARDTAALRHEILARAGGVPFFLVSCAQEARAGMLNGRAGRAEDSGVPWSAAESIRQRITALSQAAQEMLAISAVAGRRVSRAVLLLVANSLEYSESVALRALEETSHARLLVEAPEGGAYIFVHDLIRETCSTDLSGARRAALHRRIAEALESLPQLGRRAVELAWHFTEADLTARALPYALQAGDQAVALFAYAEAERDYRLASKLARALGDESREVEALEKLGGVLYTIARYEEALAQFERIVMVYEQEDDVEGQARLLAQIGWTHAQLGAAERGIERLLPLLDRFAARLSAQALLTVYNALCFLYYAIGRHTEIIAVADRAQALADATPESTLPSAIMIHRASAMLALVDRLQEGIAVTQAAIHALEANQEIWSVVFARANLSYVYEDQGAFEPSQAELEQGVASAERLGDPMLLWMLVGRCGQLRFFQGRWTEARRDLERSATLARTYGDTWGAAFPYFGLGTLDLAEGRREEGVALLERALAIARRHHNWLALRLATMALVEHDLGEGESAAAWARLELLLDDLDQPELETTRLLWLLAWAALEQGEEEQVDSWIEACITRCRTADLRRILLEALRILGLLRCRQERWEAAKAALEESLRLSRSLPFPYGEVKALYVYGQLYAAKGEPDEAREKYRAALAICARLGEGLYRPHIERALSR